MDGCRKEGGEGRAKAGLGLLMAEESGLALISQGDVAGGPRHALEAKERKMRQMGRLMNEL